MNSYDEGFQAYYDGVSLSDNPYDETDDSESCVDWDNGWREAQRQNEDA